MSTIAPHDFGDARVNTLHEAVRRADDEWRIAKATRAPADEVRTRVQAYIDACYAFQKARFGRVRVRMSVATLLR